MNGSEIPLKAFQTMELFYFGQKKNYGVVLRVELQ